jgi:hypothetical protein
LSEKATIQPSALLSMLDERLAIMHQMTPDGSRTRSTECRISRHPRDYLFPRERLTR